MATNEVRTQDQTSLLWERLTNELAPTYDAHVVCVNVAREIAAFVQSSVMVMLSGESEPKVDAWVVSAGGEVCQVRYASSAELTAVLDSAECQQINIADHTALNDALKAEGCVFGETPLIAPFITSIYGTIPNGGIAIADPTALAAPTLRSTAQFVAAYIERAFLNHRVSQQDIMFDVVNEVSTSLTSTLSLEEIYDKVSNPIRKMLNVESVSIGLVDESTGDIVFIPELLGPLFHDQPELRVKPNQGIAGWVGANGKPAVVNDTYNDDRFFTAPDEATGFTTRSILAVPLVRDGKIKGVLEAINKIVGTYDDTDLHLMQAIANPLAIAMENASLHTDVLSEKRRVETIFAEMSEGLLTVDLDGKVTMVNDSLLSLLQLKRPDIVGNKLIEVVHARNANFKEFVANVLSGEEEATLAADVYAEHRSDAVPVLASGGCIRDEHETIMEAIYVFSDLSQVREIERMRDDFFHNIVHELRTPAATILMYARLLSREIEKKGYVPEKHSSYIEKIEDQSDRVQAMVRQMLSLAKLESQQFQRKPVNININDLLAEVLAPLADRAAERGLTFHSVIEPDLPTIHGDREVVFSIFKNLTENAIKFTLEGTVSVEAWREDDMLYVEVDDDGIGIPEESRRNLFRRFYRTQTAVEHGIAGTGLGLYMVKEGVEHHKGTIDVHSELGTGTRFVVRLPIN